MRKNKTGTMLTMIPVLNLKLYINYYSIFNSPFSTHNSPLTKPLKKAAIATAAHWLAVTHWCTAPFLQVGAHAKHKVAAQRVR